MNPLTLRNSRLKYLTLAILCKLNLWWRRFAVKTGIYKKIEPSVSNGKNHHNVLQNALQTCTRCGYCRENCPAYSHDRNELYSPLAKYNLLHTKIKYGLPVDQELLNSLYRCTTCAQCDAVCPVDCPQTTLSESIRQFVMEHDGKKWSLPALYIFIF